MSYNAPGSPGWFIVQPRLSEWHCELFGLGPMGIQYRPNMGKEPHWWWRWWQWALLGNNWIKDK